MTSLKHRLKSSLDGTLGEIFYVFSFVFYSYIKAIMEVYIGGSIFQVLPVSDYSTCCMNRVLTRSVHQPRVYAFGAPTTRLRVWHTYEALTNQGDASVYKLCSFLQYKGQSPLSKRAYNTTCISCP